MERVKPNPAQQSVIKHLKGPILVVAGAGTGKTEVITRRIVNLIKSGKAPPSQILAITFTDKAAREMEARVSELLGKYVLDVQITTFNAFGYQILQRFAYAIGMTPVLKLLNDNQQLVFLQDNLDSLKLDYYSPVTQPFGMLRELADYFSRLKNELIDPDKYIKFAISQRQKAQDQSEKIEAARHLELANAFKQYESLKRANNLVDYDDQVSLVVEMFKRRPNILKILQKEISYLLIDEFQDTNSVQGKLINLLSGRHKNVMAVGDDDQAIYRFRGAAVANILDFLEHYPRAKRVSLIENYRSVQQILDRAYELIQHNNPERLEAKYRLNKRLQGQFAGSSPTFMSFITIDEEAHWIAKDIKQRLIKGQSSDSIAILIRKHSQSAILERYLESVGVEYVTVGKTYSLYQQPEVRNILNFLRVINDPRDSESLYHLLASEVLKIPAADLREYVSAARRQQQPLEEYLSDVVNNTNSSKYSITIKNFLDQIKNWRNQLPKMNVGQISHDFVINTGYIKHLSKLASRDPSRIININNLNHFFITLRDFISITIDHSVSGYLNALPALVDGGERIDVEDLPEVYGNRVRISTVHKAKGLEFETVYLFDLSQNNFPTRSSRASLEVPDALLKKPLKESSVQHIQEERRLMYVAMTRAKRDLILTFSSDHGGKRAYRPSLFISEAMGGMPITMAPAKPSVTTAQIELFGQTDSSYRTKGNQVELPPAILKEGKLRLSARQIEDYLKCPAEFYFRHILSPPEPISFALEYGSLMHNLIQYYNRRLIDNSPVSLKELDNFLITNWPQEGYVTLGHRQRGIKQAKASLRRFWQREKVKPRRPKFVEEAIEFDVNRDVSVKGRLDAVFELVPSGVEIRDYKTGGSGVTSQAKADQRTAASLQLSIYALGWSLLKGKIPEVVSLDFIDTGLVGKATKTVRQIESTEKKIISAAEGIRNLDFRPATSHLFCMHQKYGL